MKASQGFSRGKDQSGRASNHSPFSKYQSIKDIAVATMVIAAGISNTQTVLAQTPDAALSAEPAADAPLDVITLPAQEPEALPEREAPREARGIEEVIVTAQRREERLQDVPVSITVLNPEQLSNANVTNASDLAQYTPSLASNNRLGSENASFAIRGFTQTLRTTASVATYFAEVVAPRGQSLQTSGDGAGPGALFDLQNVQVLKGPQGTLFGRNSTGGAILIVPQRPKDQFEGYAEVSGGDFETRRIQAVVNLPVNDSFKVRLGIDDNSRDGYFRNVFGFGADRLGDVNYTAARASAIWNISDDVENYTLISYLTSETKGNTARLFACNPGFYPVAVVLGSSCRTQLADQAANGEDGFYDLVSTIKTPITLIEEKRLINTTTWQIADNLALKNIFGYAHLHTENGADVFGTRFHALYDLNQEHEIKLGVTLRDPDAPTTSQQTYVEELRLEGDNFDGRLDWQMGLYYEKSIPDGFSGYRSAGLVSCETATLEGAPSGFRCFDATLGLAGSVRSFKVKTKYLNEAAYAQASYELLEQLSVTAGIRYTSDHTSAKGERERYTFAAAIPLPAEHYTTTPSVKSDAVTGLAEISYRPFDDVMAYAKYVRGYRQGSVNTAADVGIDTFDPETVDTYEIGAKTSWRGALPGRFNVAVFYNDLTNMQLETGFLSRDVGSTTAIFNAGKARIAGVEAEAFFLLFRDLTLGVSYSHLDTKLIEQEDRTADLLAAAGPIAVASATPSADVGDTLPFAPDNTYVATLTYSIPVPESIGGIDLSATYVYTGKQRTTASSSSLYDELDPIKVLNMNLNWSGIWNSSFDASLFATNVLDTEYVTYTTGTYNSLGFESRQVGQPRIIGARLKYNF